MAETVTIEGKQYLKRNPLGVLGLTFITLGIYGLYWYYKINDEIRTFTRDETISPVRSLMAILFGWLIIVPPFIAVWNTANHVLEHLNRVWDKASGHQAPVAPPTPPPPSAIPPG